MQSDAPSYVKADHVRCSLSAAAQLVLIFTDDVWSCTELVTFAVLERYYLMGCMAHENNFGISAHGHRPDEWVLSCTTSCR